MSLWLIGFVAGLLVVVVVALLLTGLLIEAKRIRRLARRASELVHEIDGNTRGVWALRDTHAVAESLLQGSRAIDGNAASIAAAVSGARDAKTAA